MYRLPSGSQAQSYAKALNFQCERATNIALYALQHMIIAYPRHNRSSNCRKALR